MYHIFNIGDATHLKSTGQQNRQKGLRKMKYILTDEFDEERQWVLKNKDEVITRLMEMIGDLKLERKC
jgi:uncharacterized protein (DUF2461 family)